MLCLYSYKQEPIPFRLYIIAFRSVLSHTRPRSSWAIEITKYSATSYTNWSYTGKVWLVIASVCNKEFHLRGQWSQVCIDLQGAMFYGVILNTSPRFVSIVVCANVSNLWNEQAVFKRQRLHVSLNKATYNSISAACSAHVFLAAGFF